jgi:hypothetical protein
MDYEEQANKLEQEADKLEREGDRVEKEIGETREEWERNEGSASVPGAQSNPDWRDMEADSREESDQLPEEGPSEQVPDDDSDTGARDEAEETPGGADDDASDETATGNPDAAGSEEE